jgi:hypothetical protein
MWRVDHERFDAVARVIAARTSRRTALGALILTSVLGPTPDALAKPGNKKAKSRKRRKKRRGHGNDGGGQPGPSQPAACCGTEACSDPEPGSTRSGCDFAGRAFVGQDHNGSTFRGIDGRHAVITAPDNHGSVFAEACLQGARFRRARLDDSTWGGACLFDADFTGADVGDDLTLFANARFCNTTMPDGAVNDRDCGRATACCQAQPAPACQSAADCADEICQTKTCRNGQCAYAPVVNGADPAGQCATHCCEGVCCNPGAAECNSLGLCCAPNCAGRNCGDDGCGGLCGTCGSGTFCDNDGGLCLCTRQSCPDGCCSNGPGNPGQCRPGTTAQACGTGGEACAQCPAQQQCQNAECIPTTCAGQCTQDNDCPDLRNCVCNQAQGTCCARDCAGKRCGSDGCGGACENLCPPNTVCNTDGAACLCTAQSCPNGCCANGLGNPGTCETGNTNQACGRPGAACQTCTGQEQCQSGRCVCIPTTCAQQGRTCGTAPDGCGGTLSCGTCGDATPSCTRAGVCASCPTACPGGESCLNLANGNTACCDNFPVNCAAGCSSNDNCTDPNNPLCLVSFTTGGTDSSPNQTTTIASICQGFANAVCTSLDIC